MQPIEKLLIMPIEKQFKWVPVSEKMPEEVEKITSSGKHTESEEVLVFDSFFGPSVDRLWNGEWVSEKKVREGRVIELAVVHSITHWSEIPKPK